MNKYRDALEDMVWQFANRGVYAGKSVLSTMGLSALEHAFEVLGWPDPRFWDDDTDGLICDVKGCAGWVCVQGMVWLDAYWMVCSEHHSAWLKKEPKPEMKERAIKREASRDPMTRILPVARGSSE